MKFKIFLLFLFPVLIISLCGFGNGEIRQRIRDRIAGRMQGNQEQSAGDNGQSVAGVEDRVMNFGGLQRTYHVYRTKASQGAAPLVIVLHGGHGNGTKFMSGTQGGLNQLADQDGFIVVYPDAVEGNWNDGRAIQDYSAQRNNVDDVGFLSAIMDQMIQNENADPNRIYMAGVSNGAMMTYRFAIERSDRLRAMGCVIGSIPENITASPNRAVPLVAMNSTADPVVPWNGGTVRAGRVAAGQVIPIPETIQRWVKWNHAIPQAQVSDEPDRDPQDGTRVQKAVYVAQDGGAEVVFYTIEGGGHNWPGSSSGGGIASMLFGKTTHDISASQVISDFFRTH